MTDRGSVAAVLPVRAGPATDRVGAIDSARGLALLGIFLVNISFFALPFGQVIMPGTQPGESLADQIVYYLTSVFCSGKFYAQFSMLFGIGLVLQMTRVESRGQRFVPLYLRRLAFLLALGFIHAIGIWYGDILFTYALAGLVLFFCRRMSGRGMVILSGILFGLAIFLSVVITFLMSIAPEPGNLENKAPTPAVAQAPASTPASPAPVKEPTEWEKSPAGRLLDGFASGKIAAPQSELWMDLEREAYQKGPYVQAVVFRAVAWANFILYEIFGFFWSVLGLFFLGAGLFKLGLFEPRNIHWHKRFVWIGLFVGVPIAIFGAFTSKLSDSMFVVGALNGIAIYVAGPLMGLMYIGLMTLAVHHGAARWLTGALANVGRMALTNYLMQSLVASCIFYWFGLGYFDQLPRTTCAAIVVGIFIGQIVFSNVWLSIFRIGPMEWLWRSFTYLSLPPLFKESPGKA
jgi:uncharacterized protein